jgi:hypothetical protein
MQRHAFLENFRAAALAARDFARKFIEEALPEEMLFRVRLNSSYDGNPLVADERVYPSDSVPERARAFCECTLEQVATLLGGAEERGLARGRCARVDRRLGHWDNGCLHAA